MISSRISSPVETGEGGQGKNGKRSHRRPHPPIQNPVTTEHIQHPEYFSEVVPLARQLRRRGGRRVSECVDGGWGMVHSAVYDRGEGEFELRLHALRLNLDWWQTVLTRAEKATWITYVQVRTGAALVSVDLDVERGHAVLRPVFLGGGVGG